SASCSCVTVRIFGIAAPHQIGLGLGLSNTPASGKSLLSRVVPRTPAPELALNTGLAHKPFAALTMKSRLASGCICPRAATLRETPVAKTSKTDIRNLPEKTWPFQRL